MSLEDSLICPACGKGLTEVIAENVIVDICKNGCGGIWFDRYELKKFDEKHEAAGSLLNDNQKKSVSTELKDQRNCPRCDYPLTRHYSSVKMQIQVDECRKCGGMWLDGGELSQVRNEYENEAGKNADAKRYFEQYTSRLIDYSLEKRDQQKDIIDKIFDFVISATS